jgi:hypothetical protein
MRVFDVKNLAHCAELIEALCVSLKSLWISWNRCGLSAISVAIAPSAWQFAVVNVNAVPTPAASATNAAAIVFIEIVATVLSYIGKLIL